MAINRILSAHLALLLLFAQTAFAELPEFYRGVRAMGMGNAFTAVADDEDSIFYNPAGLAFNKKLSLHVFNPKIESSADNLKLKTAFGGGLNGDAIQKLFGKHITAGATAFPSIYLPNSVFGYYLGGGLHVTPRNLAYPSFATRYVVDQGIITGFGIDTRGFSRFSYMRLGASLKWLSRYGYDDTIPISSLATGSTTYLKNLKSGTGKGIGVSLGLQYDVPMSKTDNIIIGSTWHEIGDMNFGSSYNSNKPPPQKNNLVAGTAWVHSFGNALKTKSNFKLSLEMRHILKQNLDPRLKLHGGAEIQIASLFGSMFYLQGGMNQTSLTAGFGFDFWFLKLAAATYGVDDLRVAGLDRERRYIVQLTLMTDILETKSKDKKKEDRYRYPRKFK